MSSSLGQFPSPPSPQATGRFLVLFKPDADMQAVRSIIANKAGGNVVSSRELEPSSVALAEQLAQGNTVTIDRFKVAIIGASTDTGARLAALQADENVRQTRPEFFLFAIDDLRQRYANWVREGLQLLAEGAASALESSRVTATEASILEARVSAAPFADTTEFTWGLAAIGAHRSRFTGGGIRIAVLDTGLDLNHPDFAGRQIITRSFVEKEDIQDVQGHGTHTAGTIAGPSHSNIGRRYGVAPDVQLYVGKVLNNRGSGKEGDIINGMNWAIDQNCVAISMSLGRPTFVGERPDPLYEEVGMAALEENSLIIAAAGNESFRDSNFIAPVGAPANSPSIMAVAAVDPNLRVASFSCGGLNSNGGEVNISAPGVSVYSSFPRPQLSRILQGTSMACPHVAGMAALFAESDPNLRGQRLWDALLSSAHTLGQTRDYGRGLVRAPDAGVSA